MLAATIAAGADLRRRGSSSPGNVYNYAPDSGRIAEDRAAGPEDPQARAGWRWERMLLEEATSARGKGLVLRAGDFFGLLPPTVKPPMAETTRSGSRSCGGPSLRARPRRCRSAPSPTCQTSPRPWRGCWIARRSWETFRRPSISRASEPPCGECRPRGPGPIRSGRGQRGDPAGSPFPHPLADRRPPRRSWRCSANAGDALPLGKADRTWTARPSCAPSSATSPRTTPCRRRGARRDPRRHGLSPPGNPRRGASGRSLGFIRG